MPNAVNTASMPERAHLFVHDSRFYRDLLVLALPIVMQNLISFGISFADNLMVGQLGSVK